MILRRRVPLNEFLRREGMQKRESIDNAPKKKELSEEQKEKLKKILKDNADSGKAILLDESLKEIREISSRGFGGSLRRVNEKPFGIVLDGTVTSSVIEAAEDAGCQFIVAKSFAATSNNIQLLSF
jgi:hypothetical protein